MKIREVSPCEMCKWQPIENEEVEDDWIVNEECPISMELDCDIPLDVWENITRLTGCTCWRQKDVRHTK